MDEVSQRGGFFVFFLECFLILIVLGDLRAPGKAGWWVGSEGPGLFLGLPFLFSNKHILRC